MIIWLPHFITKSINRYCVDNSDECIFFFLVFPWIKLHLIPLLFVNCSVIPLRYFWWNYFLSNFKFSWWFVETSLFVNGMVYSYLIMIIDQQSVGTFSVTRVLQQQSLYYFNWSTIQLLLVMIISFSFSSDFF